jgi:Uma2 family endonuclease
MFMTTLAADPRAATTASPRTMADVLRDLGDVPPERIWFHPAPGTATVRDVVEIQERWNRLCELVDGVLVEKPTGLKESILAMWLGHLLQLFVEPRDLGLVAGEAGMVQLFAGLVRMPDVSFVSWETLKGKGVATEAAPKLAPDLVVEVLSLSNTAAEIDRKAREYLQSGVRLIWIVDPRGRVVTVAVRDSQVLKLDEKSTLDGGTVLPGFQLPVRDVMAKWDSLIALP